MKNLKTYILIVFFFALFAIGIFLLMEIFVEPKITNALTKISPPKANEEVVIVMIDQKSIDKIRFPWKRKLYANIIEYLNDYGKAKVVAFDSLFISPDTEFPDSDEYFYKTISKYDNYIGAFNTDINTSKQSTLNTELFNILTEKSKVNVNYDVKLDVSPFKSILNIQPEYVKTAETFGCVTTPHDSDTYIRSYVPIIRIGSANYPMLSFAAYMKAKNLDSFMVKNGYLCSIDNCNTLKVKIHNTTYGPMLNIKWYAPLDEFTTHKTYSAIDILDSYNAIQNGNTPIINPDEFNGKIVILGAAAKVKSLEDIKNTPIINNTHAGADIQATVISNLLENDFRYTISVGQKILIAFIIVFISSWIISVFGLSSSLITLGVLMLLYLVAAVTLFAKGTTIQIITPILLVLLTISAGFTFRFLIEGKKKEQIQNAMGLYISKDIMKNVVKNIDNLQRGGKRANISVLFADIRGFTSISEKLSAEEVTSILNEYFSEVEPIIRKHKGVLNKFIGDAVLAIFGEPIQDKNHARNAVLCANEMHKKITKLQQKWDLEGKPHIEIGIAINTGEAFVGNIGSPERIEYTVIGDTVNTASRIESYNRIYKTRFLISESTYEKVSRICDVIKIREVSIRGKTKKIDIYEVLRVIENANGN